jgi:hypothetical protein
MARDPAGRSLNDRDAGQATETRQMAEGDRRGGEEKVAPYLLVVALVFVVLVVVLVITR